MFLVLFGVGLLITAAGFVTIGFGIPINAFSLGNTLIIAGTVAVVGGLVLIGLAATVRQLNRIVEAINSRPMPRSAAVMAEAPEALSPPVARIPQQPSRAPAPVPPRPVEVAMPRPPEPRPEPRFPVAPEQSPPLDWLRPRSKPSDAPPIAPEPPVMDVPEEAPLSPRAPQRPMFSPPPFPTAPASERPVEPMSKEAPPIARSEQVARVSAPVERHREMSSEAAKSASKDAGLFDVVWPDARSKPMSGSEQVAREPTLEVQRPREENRAELPASERPVAILKSGVIDGMAYTLYADGSIEAELPQGTVRFASVDALRMHLEKIA